MNSYVSVNFDRDILRFIVVPGRRKFWKSVDYALVDSEVAVVVIKPSEKEPVIPALLEPLFCAIGQGMQKLAVVVNDWDGASRDVSTTIEWIKRDLFRLFRDEASSVPVFAVNIFSSESLESFMANLIKLRPSHPVIMTDPFLLCINAVYQKEDGVIVEGRVRSGTLTVGNAIHLEPAGIKLHALSMRLSCSKEHQVVSGGQLVAIKFDGISKNNISTGMILVDRPELARRSRLLRIRVHMVNNKHPIRAGFSPVVSILSYHIHAKIVSIDGSEELKLGDTSELVLSLQKTAYVRPYTVDSAECGLGRIVLRQENVIIAVGIIREILD